MNLQKEKRILIEELIHVEDREIINEIKAVLNKKKSIKDKIQPMTLERFYAKIDASVEAYENGNVISHDDLKKEVKT